MNKITTRRKIVITNPDDFVTQWNYLAEYLSDDNTPHEPRYRAFHLLKAMITIISNLDPDKVKPSSDMVKRPATDPRPLSNKRYDLLESTLRND